MVAASRKIKIYVQQVWSLGYRFLRIRFLIPCFIIWNAREKGWTGPWKQHNVFLACLTNPYYNNANQWKNDHDLPILQRHVSDQGPPAIAARFFHRFNHLKPTVAPFVGSTPQIWLGKNIKICLGSHLESNTPCLKHLKASICCWPNIFKYCWFPSKFSFLK